MGAHLINGRFQSDKYPDCPAGKVPLSTKDPLAQPLLWAYAQGRRAVDAEFSADLETALLADGYVPEPYLHSLHRSTVLRKTTPGSEEVGIVLGPSGSIVADPSSPREAVEVVNGWINDPPACGVFDLPHTLMERGIWRIASEEDAARVRTLFHEHAKARGPDSLAWVAVGPIPGPHAWRTPPVALHWGVPRLREAATIEIARTKAADAIVAAFPDVNATRLTRVRSGEIPALAALAYVMFRGNEGFRQEGSVPGPAVEIAITALCALRVAEQAHGSERAADTTTKEPAS